MFHKYLWSSLEVDHLWFLKNNFLIKNSLVLIDAQKMPVFVYLCKSNENLNFPFKSIAASHLQNLNNYSCTRQQIELTSAWSPHQL